MKIKIDGDFLTNGLRSLTTMVGAQTVFGAAKKGMLHLVGSDSGNSAELTVPYEAVEKGGVSSFAIDAQVFMSAVAKRKSLELDIKENALTVRDKGYSAELLINPYEELEVIPEEVMANKALKIKDKFIEALRQQLPKLELKPLMAIYDNVLIGIKSTDKGTFVSCYDNLQSSFYVNKELTGKLELVAPVSLFMMLTKELKGQAYQLIVTDTALYAYNDNFKLAMAIAQQDNEQIPLESVIELYKTLRKSKDGQKLVMKAEGIKSLLENAKAIYEKDCVFTFQAEDKTCKLELRSSFGNVKSKVMLDEKVKKVEFSCDFGFFRELLNKAPATLEMTVTDRVLMFDNGQVTFLLSLA